MEQEAIEYLLTFPQQNFAKNTYIVRQGQAVEYIYYLAEGSCVRNKYTFKGDEIIYDERMADKSVYCLLGALNLYSPVVIYDKNFVTKTACVCHKIYYKDFWEFLSRYPSVLHELLFMALSSYDHLDANFHAKQKGQAACRVCSFILENGMVAAQGKVLDKHFNSSEIARYLGMHRITVNKIILALCDEKCLCRTEDGLVVLDETKLMQYALGEERLDYLKKDDFRS